MFILGALAAASAATNIVGSLFQAAEAQRQGRLNAFLAESEARMSELSASSVRQQGAWQAGQIRSQASQIIGMQNVAVGASGLAATSSSAQAMRSTTEVMSSMDAEMAVYNAFLQAAGIDVQAASQRLQAQQFREQADNALVGHLLSGIGSAVGAGARFYAGMRGA